MDIWRHGRYVDLWSLVHLLSGVLLAVGFYGLGFSVVVTVLFSITLLVAWEVFEWAIRIIEPTMNVFFDILIGVIGLIMGVWWHYSVGEPFDPLVFSVLLVGTLGLTFWGFIDFHFRGYR